MTNILHFMKRMFKREELSRLRDEWIIDPVILRTYGPRCPTTLISLLDFVRSTLRLQVRQDSVPCLVARLQCCPMGLKRRAGR